MTLTRTLCRAAVCIFVFLLAAANASSEPFSDFDDGTLQGWGKVFPFNGNLRNPGGGGNPGGYLRVDDTMAGGGRLDVVAPPAFTGNLSSYGGVGWDEFLHDCSPGSPTYPILVGSDGTTFWESNRLVAATGAWQSRFVPFDAGAWERISGTASFASVLSAVAELRFSMDCNPECFFEAGLDNVTLVDLHPPPPSPDESEVDCVMLCPAGDLPFAVVVRDETTAPIAGMEVRVSFADCDSVSLCMPAGSDPYLFVARKTVAARTNAAGVATFSIRGGGISYLPNAVVSAGGVVLATMPVASTDQSGDRSLGPEDLLLLQQKYGMGMYDPTTDLNCDSVFSAIDLAVWVTHFNIGGHSPACPEAKHDLSITVYGDGNVESTPAGPPFDHAATVSLTAVPGAGNAFIGWGGDVSSRDNPLSLFMDGDKAITATFCPGDRALTVHVAGGGTVLRAPDDSCFADGAVVTLTAVPEPGWQFTGWGDDASGMGNPLELTMDGNKTVLATFRRPDRAQSTIQHPILCLAGTTGAWFTIRDEWGDPIEGTKVILSFAACDSTILCEPDGSEAFTFEPGRNVLSMITDASGACFWNIRGGGACRDSLVEVWVNGLLIARTVGATSDQDGDLIVTEDDTARLQNIATWCTVGLCDLSGDLDGNNLVTGVDLSICEQDRLAGHTCLTSVGAPSQTATAFAFDPVFPNPARGSAVMRFALPAAAPVHLVVHDLAGRVVRTAHAGSLLPAGARTWTWDGRDDSGAAVRPGLYFARLRTPDDTATRPVIVVR